MTKKHALLASIFGTLLAASSLKAGDTPGPTIAKDWSDLHTDLGNMGLAPTFTYQGEVFGNWGGFKRGVVGDALLNAALDADLGRLTGFWKDATLHLNALYIYGPDLSMRDIGAFEDPSNIAGYNSLRLQELWVQQNLWDKRASLRAGLLAADSEFFSSQASCLFLNSTFAAFSLFSANIADAPVYPVANPGVRLDVAPIPAFDLKAALFGMNSDSNPSVSNKHGFSVDINTGPLFMVEASWLVNQAPNDKGLVGSYRLGGAVQHGNGTIYCLYGIADQEICKCGCRKVEIFGRGGFAPSRSAFVDGYFDAGVNVTGFIPGRDSDVAGIAIARSMISRDFSDAQQLEGNPAFSSETEIEVTYKFQAAAWCVFQPDLQYILTPGGARGSRNATVLGLRTTLTF